MKISVICVYNNKVQYEEQLVRSLHKQTCDYELIGVNNTDKHLNSAASALDYGVKQSSGDILIFAHQDIFIKETDGLYNFAKIVYEGSTGNIYGVAGCIETNKNNIGTYTSGELLNMKYKMVEWDIQRVSCVDECFFGMKKETYDNHPFDTITCNNWHLHCVEACLYARSKGHYVYILPIQIHHFSRGTISLSYMLCLKKLIKKYNGKFKYIWTCAYKVRCNLFSFSLLMLLWKINRIIRHR